MQIAEVFFLWRHLQLLTSPIPALKQGENEEIKIVV